MEKYYLKITIVLLSFIAFTAMAWMLSFNPTEEFSIRTPGMDKKDDKVVEEIENVIIGQFFERFQDNTSTLTEVWPRFRGAAFDNIYQSEVKLRQNMDDHPEIVWTIELGEGHAGPSIYKGLVYLLDYHEEKKADMLRCFSLQSGKEQWRRWYEVKVKRNHGMSRTIPAVNEKYIVTIGPKCHVMCVDRTSGDFLWGLDVQKEFVTEIPFWYTGQCPIIHDDVAVIATGGKSLLIGIDCKSGKILWQTPNDKGWKMSHSSILPYEYNGRQMLVYSAVGGVVGIAADGPEAGKILWETERWNHSVVAPAPVCMPDGKIFLTAGYGAGSMVLQLSEKNGIFTIEAMDEYKPSEGLACEQQTPLYYRGHLIGIQPKDGGPLRNQLICVNPNNCKEVIWSSGKAYRFGLGPYLIANSNIYLLKDDGTLFIIKADVDSFVKLDEIKLFEGHDAWAPMAIADGYLLLRDSKKMYCLKISA